MKGKEKERGGSRQRLYTSILLFLIALVAGTAATVAWFSISDRGRVNTLALDVTTGISLRFDLDKHDTFEEYVKTLKFQEIATRIKREHGFDMETVPLEPVTTSSCKVFQDQKGRVISNSDGTYLEFKLHFMAQEDMVVHLTSASSKNGKEKGTKIESENPDLAKAMRISFTADGKSSIYDPGMGGGSHGNGSVKTFGLPNGDKMRYNKDNSLFSLKADKDKEVLVHIWLEGTDEKCTNSIGNSKYSISLRFQGTDKDGKIIE